MLNITAAAVIKNRPTHAAKKPTANRGLLKQADIKKNP
jgi:hypothetical protein